jgi:hypothetical protein
VHSNPSVTTWITVDDGCSISYEVSGSSETTFVCGDSTMDGFGLTMRSEALRAFLTVGAEALDKMDTIYAEERTAAGGTASHRVVVKS